MLERPAIRKEEPVVSVPEVRFEPGLKELSIELRDELTSRGITIDDTGMEAVYEPPRENGLRYINFRGKRAELQKNDDDKIDLILRDSTGNVVERYTIDGAGLVIRERLN